VLVLLLLLRSTLLALAMMVTLARSAPVSRRYSCAARAAACLSRSLPAPVAIELSVALLKSPPATLRSDESGVTMADALLVTDRTARPGEARREEEMERAGGGGGGRAGGGHQCKSCTAGLPTRRGSQSTWHSPCPEQAATAMRRSASSATGVLRLLLKGSAAAAAAAALAVELAALAVALALLNVLLPAAVVVVVVLEGGVCHAGSTCTTERGCSEGSSGGSGEAVAASNRPVQACAEQSTPAKPGAQWHLPPMEPSSRTVGKQAPFVCVCVCGCGWVCVHVCLF
jgi:hypothetical protein